MFMGRAFLYVHGLVTSRHPVDPGICSRALESQEEPGGEDGAAPRSGQQR